MAGTLTAVADPTNTPPRIVLTVTGATGTSVTVQRVDQAGNVSEVRGANPGTLVSGSWLGFDYEMPYNTDVFYVALTTTSGFALASSVFVPVSQSWLVHPGIPSLSVPLEVSTQPTISRPSSRGLFSVLGRAEAVARSDGQRKARTFDLSVRSFTISDEDALSDIIEDDSVLLLQVADGRVYRPLYAWVSVGDVTETPMATYREGWLEWSLPCTEAARPVGLLQTQRTWADVVAGSASWTDAVATFATWRDLVVNDQIEQSSSSGGGGGGASGETFVHNADGTVTETGGTTNPDGTITIVSGVDNPDGTVTVG